MRKNEILKKLFVVAFFTLFGVQLLLGAIVFDGSDSYSSYEGQAKPIKSICLGKPVGAMVFLHDIIDERVDYTTVDEFSNRSSIMNPSGMIIQAEGFYSLTKGRGFGRIAKFCGNRFKVSQLPGCTIAFKISVKKPGFYTFSLDGSAKVVARSIVRLFSLDENGNQYEANGFWQVNYSTKDWNNMVESYGGLGPDDLYSITLHLDKKHTELFLYFESVQKTTIQVDAIRVIDYSDGKFVDSIHSEKMINDKLFQIKEGIERHRTIGTSKSEAVDNNPVNIKIDKKLVEQFSGKNDEYLYIFGIPLLVLLILLFLLIREKRDK